MAGMDAWPTLLGTFAGSCCNSTSVPNGQSISSHLPRIIRPMQQRLALLTPAFKVASAAVLFHLGDMACNRAPAFDLALVVGAAAAHVVAAVPLEPAARV